MQYSTNGIIIAKGSTHQALTPLSTHHQAQFLNNGKNQWVLHNVILSFLLSYFLSFLSVWTWMDGSIGAFTDVLATHANCTNAHPHHHTYWLLNCALEKTDGLSSL